MRSKLIPIALAGALLAGTAACTDTAAGASPGGHHTRTRKASSRVITAKAHIEGTDRYFLTLQGAKHPVAVSKRTFKRCGVGSRYPRCA